MFSALRSFADPRSHQSISDTWEFPEGQWGIHTMKLGELRNRKSLFCVIKGLAKVLVFFFNVTTVLNIGETKSY